MCARRSPRQVPADPENQPTLVVPQPPPPDDLPAGLDDEPEMGGAADDLGDLFALSDESYRDVVWYVWRRRVPGQILDRKTNPNAPIYVAKVVGPIDLDELARRIGGGSFRLCGFRNGRKFIERPLEIEGPHKDHNRREDPAPTAAAPVTTDVAASIAAAVERVLERHEQRTAQQPPANPTPQASMRDVIEMARMLRPETAPANPDATVVNTMLDMFRKGIELGATRESNGGTDWAAVVEKSAPLVERLIAGIASRRVMPPRRTAPAPTRPESRAEVVGDPNPAPVNPPADDPSSVRMAAVVDSLSRAVEAMGSESEIDPADFAATVETVLMPAELSMLRLTTTDGLMAELAAVSDRFPALTTPEARAYVDAVLSELRTPPVSE